MKKISINLRLFLWFSALVLLVFFTIWISNTIILEKYYQFYKEESLAKTYNSIKKIYNSSESFNSLELEKLETNQNIDIVIKDNEKLTVYSTNKDFSNNMFFIPEYAGFINSDYILKRLEGDTEYFTEIKGRHLAVIILFVRWGET